MRFASVIAAATLVTSAARADPLIKCGTSFECHDDTRCIDGACRDPVALAAYRATRRLHPFIGIVALVGPAIAGDLSGGGFDHAAQGTALFALRAGFIAQRLELALEVSPFTYFYYQRTPGPTFQANMTFGYLMPISKNGRVVWPLRFGGGFFAGNVGGDAYFQMRADVIGIAIRAEHILLNVYAPSFRYAISTPAGIANLLSWESGVSVDYVF